MVEIFRIIIYVYITLIFLHVMVMLTGSISLFGHVLLEISLMLNADITFFFVSK